MTTSATASSSHTYNPTSGARCNPPTYASDLERLVQLAVAVRDDAESLAAGLSDAQFNWKPSPVRWSIAQCIKHLVLTGTMAANEQDAAIARLQAAGKRSDGPYKYGGLTGKFGNMLSGSVEPPVQKKFKTARKVVPAEQHDHGALVAEFLKVYERLEKNVSRAKGLDLGAASVSLPVPLVKMKLGQSLAFEIAHARRHLWQARQVRNEPAFPKS